MEEIPFYDLEGGQPLSDMVGPSVNRVCWMIPPPFSAGLRSCGHLHAQRIIEISRIESDSGSNGQLASYFQFREPQRTTYWCIRRRRASSQPTLAISQIVMSPVSDHRGTNRNRSVGIPGQEFTQPGEETYELQRPRTSNSKPRRRRILRGFMASSTCNTGGRNRS